MKPVWYKNRPKNKDIPKHLKPQAQTAKVKEPPKVIDLGEPPADGIYPVGGVPVEELGITPPPVGEESMLGGGLVVTAHLTVETPSPAETEASEERPVLEATTEDTSTPKKKKRKKNEESVASEELVSNDQ